MVQLKTSTKISIKFTVFTIIIVIFFWIFANILFFQSRYNTHNRKLQHPRPSMGPLRWAISAINHIQEFPKNSKASKILKENIIRKNISHIDEYYFITKKTPEVIMTINITNAIDNQIKLIKITLILLGIFGTLAYWVSRIFVKTTLKRLRKLTEYTQNLDLYNIHKPFNIQWYDKDEINIVAEAINKALQKIHQQTESLKDFIAHASHEMRTPLMAMSTELDYITKSKDLSSLSKLKNYIKQMDQLFNQLIIITKIENTTKPELEKKKITLNINPIINKIIKTIQQKYTDNTIKRDINIPQEFTISCHQFFLEIIIQNLLDNAVKYNRKSGTISINTTNTTLEIKDTWTGIKDTTHIRNKFRQEDESKTDKKSFWLGLYLVKKLINIHKRKIKVISQKGIWTTFTIYFK